MTRPDRDGWVAREEPVVPLMLGRRQPLVLTPGEVRTFARAWGITEEVALQELNAVLTQPISPREGTGFGYGPVDVVLLGRGYQLVQKGRYVTTIFRGTEWIQEPGFWCVPTEDPARYRETAAIRASDRVDPGEAARSGPEAGSDGPARAVRPDPNVFVKPPQNLTQGRRGPK